MEKYLIDKNFHRVLAHAKRASKTEITKSDVITLKDSRYAVKVDVEEGAKIENIEVANQLPE